MPQRAELSNYISTDAILNLPPSRIVLDSNGCMTQRIELQALGEELKVRGMTTTSEISEADAVIFTTCGVTTEAVNDAKSKICGIRAQTKAPIFVGGCMPAIEGANHQLDLGENVYIFDSKELYPIFIQRALDTDTESTIVPFWVKNFTEKLKLRDELAQIDFRLARAYEQMTDGLYIANEMKNPVKLRVSSGCNSHCTYCAIPKARGKHETTPPQILTNAISQAKLAGFNRIILNGENLGQYGVDVKKDKIKFNELLRMLVEVNPNVELSARYIEPPYVIRFSSTLIDLAKKGNIYYIGIPIQSGSESVLKRMHRSTKISDFMPVFKQLRDIDGLYLGTMFINGFPGETLEDHKKSLDLINEMDFDLVNCQPFSVRPGTPAEVMPNQISTEEKNRRYQEMMSVIRRQKQKRLTYYIDNYLGTRETSSEQKKTLQKMFDIE